MTTLEARALVSMRVLIVDDNPGDAHLAITALEEATAQRYEIELAETVADALDTIDDVDLVLLDLGLPDASGLDGLRRIREAAPRAPIVVLTGNGELALAEEALQVGAQDYLVKDELDGRTLERSLRYALVRHELLWALDASERWSRSLIHSVSDIVSIHGPDGQLLHVGGLGARLLGPASDVGIDEVRRRVDRQTWRRMVRAFCGWRRGDLSPLEFTVNVGEAGERCYESVPTNLLDDPLIGGIVVTSRDVTDRFEIQRRLSHDATHDSLTGLGNRLLFNMRLQEALIAQRLTGLSLAVLLVDLDDFKKINDSFGHAAGDEVLRSIGSLLTVALREHDTLARIGGDEFVVICPDVDLEGAEAIASRLQHLLSRPFRTAGREVFLRASVGIALADQGATAESLLRDADLALYESKRLGKATVHVFSEELEVRAVRRMEIETELHGAIARGELSLRYQPILDLGTGVVAGHEALLRWRHSTLGDVDTEEMIRVAEESGLIIPIGRWVLEQACRQVCRWRRQHPHRDFYVAVNVSAAQLAEPSFVDELIAVLQLTGVPPRAICAEVTETSLIGHLDRTQQTLDRLRSAGVRVALDDFGTGYSSLTYLRRLPVDVLKIDRSFTEGIAQHASDRAVVGSVLRMARALGVEVVAEGVEDVDQRDELRRLGCRYGQGYLWSRPVPAGPAGDLLDEVLEIGGVIAETDEALTGCSAAPERTATDEALAVVVHDLMQPLTVIRGFAENFELLSADQDPRSLFDTISRNANDAIDIVGCLRDAGALERSTLALQLRPAPLDDVLAETIGDLRTTTTVPVRLSGRTGVDLALDLPRFRQIVANLVRNAAKFAPPGTSVHVHAERTAQGVAVSVVDSGPGVPPEREPELFRRFAKLGDQEGTGLGLYISRQLARLHGGDLTYRRAATGGAEFVLHFPVGADRITVPGGDPAPGGRRRAAPPDAETPADAPALAALHQATRALLFATHPEHVVGAAIRLVRQLGGGVVPAAFSDVSALPLDLAMGEGPPLLPTAAPLSVARQRLERVLPLFAEDARDHIQRLRTMATGDEAMMDPETGLPRRADDDHAPPVRSVLALRLATASPDARLMARLVRSVADERDTLCRWSDDVLVVASATADAPAAMLRDQLIDQWVRWGGDGRIDIALAAADSAPATNLIDLAVASLAADR